MTIIHGQAKKVTWGVSSQGAMSKICRPPSAAGKFFTWGASSLGTFAIFKLSAPILEGGGTHFTLGSVHFSPFLLRELQGRVKKFSAALPRRHPREAAPPYFFTSGVDQKNFFTQGCTPPLPPLCPCMNGIHKRKNRNDSFLYVIDIIKDQKTLYILVIFLSG